MSEKDKTKSQNQSQSKEKTHEEIRKEVAAKNKARDKRLKEKREKALKEKKYVPAPKTGKMFHVNLETLTTNKKGKKISAPSIQIMDLGTFVQWLASASRLGIAFGLAHDPIGFFDAKQQGEIIDSLKTYVKTADMDNMEYAVRELQIASDSFINKKLKTFYKKREEHIASLRKQATKQSDYLD
jgi:hypothetical protein